MITHEWNSSALSRSTERKTCCTCTVFHFLCIRHIRFGWQFCLIIIWFFNTCWFLFYVFEPIHQQNNHVLFPIFFMPRGRTAWTVCPDFPKWFFRFLLFFLYFQSRPINNPENRSQLRTHNANSNFWYRNHDPNARVYQRWNTHPLREKVSRKQHREPKTMKLIVNVSVKYHFDFLFSILGIIFHFCFLYF